MPRRRGKRKADGDGANVYKAPTTPPRGSASHAQSSPVPGTLGSMVDGAQRLSATMGASTSPSGDPALAAAHLGNIQKQLEETISELRVLQDTTPDQTATKRMAEKRIAAYRDAVVALTEARTRAITAQVTESLDRLVEEIGAVTSPAAVHQEVPSAERAALLLRQKIFSEKKFSVRSSVLSNMLMDKDFQTIYHIFVVCLVWLGISIAAEEWYKTGRLPDLSLIVYAFGQADVTMFAWLAMFITSCGVVWLVQAIKACNLPILVWMWPYWVIQSILCLVPITVSLHYELPPASGFIVMCECARMVMKVHGYLREKLLYGMDNREFSEFLPPFAKRAGCTVKDICAPDIKIDDLQTECGRFLYYHFAPTLIYRDRYPRNKRHVRWLHALLHLGNVIGAIFYTFVIFRVFCTPYFQASNSGQPGDFVMSVFRSMMPSMLVFILAFFGVLHSWFNLWAELLRFGDRQFYQDWWTARSFGTYYRKWNRVVHEWLYHYLYLDAIRFSRGKFGKQGGALLVFVVSAIFHEFVIAGALGFWHPVLLVMFGGPGVFFVKLTAGNTRFFNLFMWLMLSVGMGLLMVLYSMEWYSRFGDEEGHPNLPKPGFWWYWVPRSLPSQVYDTTFFRMLADRIWNRPAGL